MSTSALNERSRSNPLCDFRLGTVVTSDYETPLTTFRHSEKIDRSAPVTLSHKRGWTRSRHFHLAQVLTHHKEDFDSGRVRTTDNELAFISSSGTVVLQWCSFWSLGEGRPEPSSEIAPSDASREAALFLGAYGDNLESVSAALILDELHTAVMSHIPQDESPHFPFKLGPPEYVPSQVRYRRGNVVSLSVNIRTQILANHENINTMRFRPHIEKSPPAVWARPLGYPKQ